MSAAVSLAQGRAKLADGDLRGALQAARAAIAAEPRDADSHLLLAELLRMQGDFEGAAASLERTRTLAPGHAGLLMQHALLLAEQRDVEGALDRFSELIFRDPGNARAHYEMGRLLRIQGALDEAFACQAAAVEADPQFADAYTELGWLHDRRRDYASALAANEKALELQPDHRTALHNLGFTLGKLEHYERGLQVLEKLCERVPVTHTGPWVNLATALAANGELARAEAIYERVLEVEPNNVSARWNRSHFILARHDFARGWPEYEWRLLTNAVRPRLLPHAPWRGEPLEGKSIVLSADQGLGDEMMFASCAPDVIARAREVTIECAPRLAALFRRSFAGARVVEGEQDLEPDWLPSVRQADFHSPMSSLPLQLRTCLDDFPRHRGYLRAAPERVEFWRSRLAGLGAGLKVGLSWRGGTQATRKRLRSLDLGELRSLCSAPRCRFVSLQYGDCAAEVARFTAETGIPVAHWPEAIQDYDETAALCAALDLTVSVCTSIIHLNGALGRPVWILVPSVPEWRYGFAGEHMPWYPSARLFRQDDRGTWTPVVERVVAELARFQDAG